MLFSFIVLTQIYEWVMLIKFLHFQIPSKHQLQDLPGLRSTYNKKEKWSIAIYFLFLCMYAGMNIFID